MAESSQNSGNKHHHHNHAGTHVRFPEAQCSEDHELGIIVQEKSKDCLEVHLGFLQLHRHYTIEFDIIDSLGHDTVADPIQNLHCRITKAIPTDDGLGHHVFIDFHAHKDKLDNETLVLSSEDKSKSITLVLMARVLGKHKGTPMLKNGIKCVGIDPEEESDQSDWQGFD